MRPFVKRYEPIVALFFALALTACGAASPQPTVIGLPPTSQISLTTNIPPTASSSEQVWKTQPVGTSNVTITFYNNPSGTACIRYQLDVANSTPVEKCATSRNLVAVQGSATDSAGKLYTIIVGRILDDHITAVSLEMSGGDNTPAEVDNGGFVLVSPNQQRAVRAVPIDQYGNLVGQIFAFG